TIMGHRRLRPAATGAGRPPVRAAAPDSGTKVVEVIGGRALIIQTGPDTSSFIPDSAPPPGEGDRRRERTCGCREPHPRVSTGRLSHSGSPRRRSRPPVAAVGRRAPPPAGFQPKHPSHADTDGPLPVDDG